jgi:hypothetical protein
VKGDHLTDQNRDGRIILRWILGDRMGSYRDQTVVVGLGVSGVQSSAATAKVTYSSLAYFFYSCEALWREV